MNIDFFSFNTVFVDLYNTYLKGTSIEAQVQMVKSYNRHHGFEREFTIELK